MNRKNIRIKDIARLAGVSVGTVDRVLHNRGRVSEDALNKVMKILEEIDYKPNLIARTLGSNKIYKIAVLMPDPSRDPYWRAQARVSNWRKWNGVSTISRWNSFPSTSATKHLFRPQPTWQ
ncbi:MAG: LacI family transcriptional regulator [Bacteroidia bacterium]|nr:LacI family transcriptional regulator [Bacteroidia bacterium]